MTGEALSQKSNLGHLSDYQDTMLTQNEFGDNMNECLLSTMKNKQIRELESRVDPNCMGCVLSSRKAYWKEESILFFRC